MKNCALLTDTIRCQGHYTRSRRSRFAFLTTFAVHRLKLSSDIVAFRSFPVFCKVFLRIVFYFAQKSSTLDQHLSEDQPAAFLPLNNHDLDAAQTPQAAIVTPLLPVLSYSRGCLTLGSDACSGHAGCTLQKHPVDTTKPV